MGPVGAHHDPVGARKAQFDVLVGYDHVVNEES